MATMTSIEDLRRDLEQAGRLLHSDPGETLERAREIALDQGLRYAYVGNLPGHPGNNTYCPSCGELVIARMGFAVVAYHLEGGICSHCDEPIAGVWWPGEAEGQPVTVSPAPADQ